MKTLWTAVALCVAAAASLAAQSIGARVDAVRDGTVHMSFPARAGVCGDGRGSVWIQGHHEYDVYGGSRICVAGPVHVTIGRSDGQTISVRKFVGHRTGSAETDVGNVSAVEAAHYLLGIAPSLRGSNATEATDAAAFADAGDLSTELTQLVRDQRASIETRKQALFWLGESEAPSGNLVRLYSDLEAFALREHFTFVISQRHDDPAVDKLIDIAQHDGNFEVRKRAMFWLGQSSDPRALRFFRDVLIR